jgi:hypothetical protein
LGDFGVSGQAVNSVANTFVGTSGYMSVGIKDLMKSLKELRVKNTLYNQIAGV